MFKVGDQIKLSKKGVDTYSKNDWRGYGTPCEIYKNGGFVTDVRFQYDRTEVYVQANGGSSTVWLEPDDLELAEEAAPVAEDWMKADDYSTAHYDSYYTLTDEDIKAGKIKMDAYFVAKVWRTGSRDDSGALWHSLKTIARFGDKNPVEREIKALYNQAKALGRIYGVNLDD